METKSPIENRTNLIAARVSTAERIQAEDVMQKLGVDSYGQLFRRLLNEKAEVLGV